MLDVSEIPDFSYERYKQLLSFAKQNFTMANYSNCFQLESFLLIRHDVDCSLNIALKIAKMEHELGIQATYFVNPHCEFYNLLEASQTKILKEIIRLGHDVGLHFDNAFHLVNQESQLEMAIREDVSLIENFFDIKVRAFSFHNPNEFLLNCEAHTYADLINCYSKWFKEEVSYCSDSNGVWRYRNVTDALEEEKSGKLQILLHPNWWRTGSSPRNKILSALIGRALNALYDYDDALDKAGRPNLSVSEELLHSSCANKTTEHLLDLLHFFAVKHGDSINFRTDLDVSAIGTHVDLKQVRLLAQELADFFKV